MRWFARVTLFLDWGVLLTTPTVFYTFFKNVQYLNFCKFQENGINFLKGFFIFRYGTLSFTLCKKTTFENLLNSLRNHAKKNAIHLAQFLFWRPVWRLSDRLHLKYSSNQSLAYNVIG
jgi:hypothetical protein